MCLIECNTTLSLANGRYVGYGYDSHSYSHCLLWNAADGSTLDLGGGPGPFTCEASGVNDSGQVTGYTMLPGNALVTAFLWQDGVFTDLGTLPGGLSSNGVAINRKGHVAMTSYRQLANGGQASHIALWTGVRVKDLGALPGSGEAWATSLNDQDDVVGRSVVAGYWHGAVYTAGALWDLASVVDNAAGWDLSNPFGIGDDGTIVGTAMFEGESHGYMLVPGTSSP